MQSRRDHPIANEFVMNITEDKNIDDLTAAIKVEIEDGTLVPGASLPGERKLADSLGVSRITVRRAVETLVTEGHLVRRQGARTSVANGVRKQISNFTKSCFWTSSPLWE